MRSGFAAGLMGIGGILLSFGSVIVVLAIFAREGGATRLQLPEMTTVALGSLVVGAVMFGAGFLLSRVGRNSNQSAGDRSTA
jgi:ABC-type transport system involved in multi-copper enzyme maturation permease subunit